MPPPKGRRAPNQLAKLVVDMATGDAPNDKNAILHAPALAGRGSSAKARAARLTPGAAPRGRPQGSRDPLAVHTMSAPQTQDRRQPTKAARSIQRATEAPTTANVIDAISDLHDHVGTELQPLKGDVGTIKEDVGTLKGDVGKLLHHFGLVSGSPP